MRKRGGTDTLPENALRLDDACSASVSVLRSNKRIIRSVDSCRNLGVRKGLTQRREDAKEVRSLSPTFLCVFAPLRENFRIDGHWVLPGRLSSIIRSHGRANSPDGKHAEQLAHKVGEKSRLPAPVGADHPAYYSGDVLSRNANKRSRSSQQPNRGARYGADDRAGQADGRFQFRIESVADHTTADAVDKLPDKP